MTEDEEINFEENQRYLVLIKDNIIEVKVLEISPSEEFVKLRYASFEQVWEKITEFTILEKLKEIKENGANT
jgi:hypothetical protein